MSRKTLSTPDAPAAVGPYVQGVAVGDLVFLAGQIPLDPATGELVAGGVPEQTERVIANIRAVLASEGLTLAHVVKTTVFLTDLGQFGAMNAVYASQFGACPPARSTVEVSALPKGAQVEIEVLAHRGAAA